MTNNFNMIQESMSQGFRHFNTFNIEDSQHMNSHNPNSNVFGGPINLNENSYGFHHLYFLKQQQEQQQNVESAVHHQDQQGEPVEEVQENKIQINKNINKEIQQDDEDQQADDQDMKGRKNGKKVGAQNWRYNPEERQKLSNLSSKVMDIIRQESITNSVEITKMLVVDSDDNEEQSLSEKRQIEVRRIRRRVYDTLNVFSALGVIDKIKPGNVKCQIKPNETIKAAVHRRRINKYKIRSLKQQEALYQKRRLLESKKKQYELLAELIKKNKAQIEMGKQQINKLDFPFLAFVTDKNSSVQYNQLSDEKAIVKTTGNVKVMGDLDFIEYINKYRTTNFDSNVIVQDSAQYELSPNK